MKQLLGRKMGMTEVFAEDGTMYPVTVIEVLPNTVLGKRTKEKNGYEALQIGYEDAKSKSLSKPLQGFYKKSGVSAKKHIVELKGDEIYSHEVGESFGAEIFASGEVVDVIGTSKGHGYSGTIKRYHHHIGPKGHGSGYHRQIGSLANNGRCNNRVIPGKTMSGHHGNESATVLNLLVVESNPEKGYILVKGGIPGPRKGLVVVRSAVLTQFKKPVLKTLVDLKAKEEAELAAKKAAEEAARAEAEAKKTAEEAAKKAAEEAAKAAEANKEAKEEPAPVASEAKSEEKGE